MADMITLTAQPIRVTAATFQPIYLAVDIGAYDFFDMEAGIVGTEGSALTAFDLELWTGMQTQVDDGWAKVGAQFNFTIFTANTWVTGNFPNTFLRYLRWKVVSFAGATAVTFFIRGMARRYA